MSDTNHQEWWRGAVMYQIYPRSFMDSNGDGIGDLNGITERLDYVASLGVDGIWISPFFKSPQKDFGYDVSDYRDVDPMFGTLEDFDRLLARAHELNLKVVIDQVYSHSSIEHEWFAESRVSQDNPKADWYVWEEARLDGLPPNNWLSAFGGPAWTWDGRRRQYYLHNFLSDQPDLNLHNHEVQDALLDVSRFWLERGVDGFRLDAINLGMHDPELRDNPPLPRVNDEVPEKPYFMQNPVYNLSHDDMPGFLERLRQVADEYGEKFTVAEVGGIDPHPVQRAYTGGCRLSTAYAWEFLIPFRPDTDRFRDAFDVWPDEYDAGWPSWAFCNHDAPRVVTRWRGGEDGGDDGDADWARLFALLLMSLRGNIFIYQGEELGLPQADVPFEKLQDPEGIINWPNTLGRDGARTPMPWKQGEPHCGFSSAEPWLPVEERHDPLSVDAQDSDPFSVLNFFRELIAVRKSSPALKYGRLRLVPSPPHVLAFTRTHGDETVVCVFNLAAEPVTWHPELEAFDLRLSAGMSAGMSAGAGLPELLPAFSGYIGTVS
ncbi:MAG: alpha-glucosidase family protein [Xanthomonadales bacterium]|nr:alpha-glucosidase family protein [Xanthomonadales bacterium]